MMKDSDGMIRVDIEWTIEGTRGARSGKLYEMHEAEVEGAKHTISLRARRGDTVTIKVI